MKTKQTGSVRCPACDGLGLTLPASRLIGTAIGIPSYRPESGECSACRGTGRIRPARTSLSMGDVLSGLRARFSLAS
ncbi:hypothetical protein [Georgenia ruanii]|uniref:hypothetical protein n=1 Tax=Georgenia ruanii TaxID=348442 RepID=UPI001264CC79|nr:hypothetical protein [Georgenia ruanii]